MATNQKIAEIIASIKLIFPYYAKEHTEEKAILLMELWNECLKEFPDDTVDVAFRKCLRACTVPPTPADVIRQLNGMRESAEQSDEELWNVLLQALRKADNLQYYFRFTMIESNGKTQGENAKDKVTAIWNGLPVRLQRYIGGKGEFIRMSRYLDTEELKYEKTRFLKTMPDIKDREEYSYLKALADKKYDSLDTGTGSEYKLTDGDYY